MRATELGELEAFRDLWKAAPPGLSAELGLARLERGGTLCIAASAFAGELLFNRVLGLGLDEPASEELLDEIDTFYRAAGTRYGIALAPDAGAGLDGRGFEPGYAWTKFERPAGPASAVETELRVERVGREGAADFALAALEGYGMPPVLRPMFEALPERPGWDCFVSYAGTEPAGVGAVFTTGDVGWLGIGATRPDFRRRGSQGAILAARFDAAAARGCTVVVSETGERVEGRPATSYANLERAGLVAQYVRPNLLSP